MKIVQIKNISCVKVHSSTIINLADFRGNSVFSNIIHLKIIIFQQCVCNFGKLITHLPMYNAYLEKSGLDNFMVQLDFIQNN